MSVFNEDGALVYAQNANNISLDSIIAEAARMDNILENMIMEAVGQLNAADIVLECSGYVNESVKEVVRSGWKKAINAVLKALDHIVEVLHNLVPAKGIILANKKKIISKFDEAKNSDNESFKEVIKNYNSISRIDSKKLMQNIEAAIMRNGQLMQKRTLAPQYDYTSEIGKIIGIELTKKNWKEEISQAIGPEDNATSDASNININTVIDTALSIDKNIPAIKQKRREVEKMMKDINNGDYIPGNNESADEESRSAKYGLPIVSYYCVTAIKSLRLLATSSVKLCMAVLKYKEPKDKDSKTSDSDNKE